MLIQVIEIPRDLSLHVAFKFQLPSTQIDHLQTGAMISHAGVVLLHVCLCSMHPFCHTRFRNWPYEVCTKIMSWVESIVHLVKICQPCHSLFCSSRISSDAERSRAGHEEQLTAAKSKNLANPNSQINSG